MAFLDSMRLKRGNTFFNQRLTDSLASIIGVYRKVMQITPATIMSAQNRHDNPVCGFGHETKPGIAIQIGNEIGFRIRITEPDAFTTFPKP